ncbi:MAG: DUF2914 domain-containing protein [Candidatus Thiodiazotropha sp.]|nr:DUF2914 domain-containing protein [Candidatus Thiodiazotropha taylori]MBT3058961.1 DUF2914 domain-containing protein [Candidatus Thiodiazotropha sp. (ex Lucina pensylvanica)]MBT3063865.1 DUF2914 domain-containing protein [Candidatus Thiodiazotropha sp. (ex Lucina pensylvanica)]PUB73214.1 MAG: DUF2914 domain-containing protein [gamma proteobacterium symbiont of Ctena orbiculata]
MSDDLLRNCAVQAFCALQLFQLHAVDLRADELRQSPVPDAIVARAQFTTEIVNREPVDQVVKLDSQVTRVFFFTDLRNLQGRTIIHRWEFEGEVVSEVEFNVAGPRWRVYSAKSLNPGESGKWTVFVIDESGWPLHASIFEHGVTGE